MVAAMTLAARNNPSHEARAATSPTPHPGVQGVCEVLGGEVAKVKLEGDPD